MNEQKAKLIRMEALIDDLQTVKDFIRSTEQPVTDGKDLWLGLGCLGDFDSGKEMALKPLAPKHKVTRQAIVDALEVYMPKVRDAVITAIRAEYNKRLVELKNLDEQKAQVKQ
ncbi:MAG: hypothetical protein K8R90_09350 [Candidatus Cloacimonetes bacterium]|nr:hypothetical protein [Candidatus Cloacimonadota bacterium]